MKKLLFIMTALSAVALTFTSCDTYTGQGAGWGAATGAVLGAAATGSVRGAATGAAIGAGTGALIGSAIGEEEAGRYGPVPSGGYPWARRSGTPGLVVSPYPPHRLVDVHGIPHGALVRDPSTGGVFRRP